jgi:hypothetical protein
MGFTSHDSEYGDADRHEVDTKAYVQEEGAKNHPYALSCKSSVDLERECLLVVIVCRGLRCDAGLRLCLT